MIKRQIAEEFRTLLGEYPIVTLVGPRQAGKTTLARGLLPDYAYRSLEDPDTGTFAREDPRGFLAEAKPPVILDEIQRVPELLSYLQGMVDRDGTHGQYVLTGSHQLELRAAVSQSLAGRTALLHLLPLSVGELIADRASRRKKPFAWWAHQGFLPRVHAEGLRPTPAYAGYYQTYVERDVRQLIRLKDASLFDKFMRLLAGRTGQLMNKESLGNDVGVDSKTVDHWLSILEASFVVFKVPPYHENFGKRVIKSPKYYFVDPGLLVYLLGIKDPEQVARDPLLGAIFENVVACELLKAQCNRGQAANLFFFRDNNGRELDLLLPNGRELMGIEVKAGATARSKMFKELDNFHHSIHPLKHRYLVYNGEARTHSDGGRFIPFVDIEPAVNHWL